MKTKWMKRFFAPSPAPKARTENRNSETVPDSGSTKVPQPTPKPAAPAPGLGGVGSHPAPSASSPGKRAPDADLRRPGAPPPGPAISWFRAEDASIGLRQWVIRVPPGLARASEFATLMLSHNRYPNLWESTWSTGFFGLDGKPGPFLLIRADHFAANFRQSEFSVALSFFRFPAGGLFAVYVRLADSSIMPRLRERVPDLQLPVMEGATGLDGQKDVDQIAAGLGAEQMHLVVAGNSAQRVVHMDLAAGQRLECAAAEAAFDVIVPMSSELRSMLQQEWSATLSYHRQSPRSWNRILAQYYDAMPLTRDPILPERRP